MLVMVAPVLLPWCHVSHADPVLGPCLSQLPSVPSSTASLSLPEKSLLLCRVPEQLNKYPIMAFGDESFRQCQDTSLSPQHYIAFFTIGPFSFLASIFFCTFLGSLVVFYHSLRRESHCWRSPRVCRVH